MYLTQSYSFGVSPVVKRAKPQPASASRINAGWSPSFSTSKLAMSLGKKHGMAHVLGFLLPQGRLEGRHGCWLPLLQSFGE